MIWLQNQTTMGIFKNGWERKSIHNLRKGALRNMCDQYIGHCSSCKFTILDFENTKRRFVGFRVHHGIFWGLCGEIVCPRWWGSRDGDSPWYLFLELRTSYVLKGDISLTRILYSEVGGRQFY